MTRTALLRAVVFQAVTELVLTLRRGESVLVTIVIPVALLAFFASSQVLPAGASTISFLLPGTLALALISTGLVSLGIATAYERHYGVLKRFGATPFPRAGLLAAKLLAVAMLEAVQVVLMLVISLAVFGWRPAGSVILVVVALLLGTIAFAGLGLLMAGALRAEATLAGANGLFLFFLLLGGLYVPLDHLPAWLVPIANVLPAAALAEVLRAALRVQVTLPGQATLVLVLWAIAAPLAAALTFRWE